MTQISTSPANYAKKTYFNIFSHHLGDIHGYFFSSSEMYLWGAFPEYSTYSAIQACSFLIINVKFLTTTLVLSMPPSLTCLFSPVSLSISLPQLLLPPVSLSISLTFSCFFFFVLFFSSYQIILILLTSLAVSDQNMFMC